MNTVKKPASSDYVVCKNCIYDSNIVGIEFDDEGVCNYCHQIDDLQKQYGTGEEKGEKKLQATIEEIKREGKNKPYDCIVGVSGGTDSSYMLSKAIEWGLRPLAVHYDNTWNSAIATQNIYKVVTALDVDLFTYVVDNKESEDIFKAFLTSGVAELEASTDLALAEVMYRVAWKYKINYVLEGHSFITEGISPLGSSYFDGKYIQSIHKQFGSRNMETYPLMTFSRFMWWSMFAKIKKIRPFWFINYDKEKAKTYLKERFDWEYYGGHHLENKITAFTHSVYYPQKFNQDFRNLTLAASVRAKKMDRDAALSTYRRKPDVDPEIIENFKQRLSLTDAQYERLMSSPNKQWNEFPTYKKRFELFRPIFFLLAKAQLVPMSFYLKYCFPMPK